MRQAFKGCHNVLEQGPLALGKGGPKLVEQTAQGVGLHDAHFHEQLALAVQGQRCLLHRQPDRTGIGGIGFVAADKRAHNFGVQQSHRVPEFD
jgi:hypothetical protein